MRKSGRLVTPAAAYVGNSATCVERQSLYRSCMRMLSTGEDVGVYSWDPGDVWWGNTVVSSCIGERNVVLRSGRSPKGIFVRIGVLEGV